MQLLGSKVDVKYVFCLSVSTAALIVSDELLFAQKKVEYSDFVQVIISFIEKRCRI